MQIRFRTYFAAATLAGVLGAAGPALSQTATPSPPPPAPAPATEGQSAGQSFSNAWSDLKSSADNAWQALKHGTKAAAHGANVGWQATKESASTPSDDQTSKQ